MMQARLQDLAQRPGLASDDRLLTALLSALCYPHLDLVRDCGEAALAHGVDPVALRETAMQGIAYAGFPRALTALEVLAPLLPPDTGDTNPDDVFERGWKHFEVVYGRHSDKLFAKIRDFDRDFGDLTIRVAYGHLLARPRLAGKPRELMALGALSVLDLPRQLIAHAFGARHFGATDEEIREATATPALLFEGIGERGHQELVERAMQGQ